MNRAEWIAFYHDLRADRRADDAKPRNKGMGRAMRMIRVNDRLYTVACGFGADHFSHSPWRAFRIVPSMILDRSPQYRKADALAWAAWYRAAYRRAWSGPIRSGRMRDALACIQDCRAIPQSAFARLP